MEIVLHTEFGGFSLSNKAIETYNNLSGGSFDYGYFAYSDGPKRNCKFLIETVREMHKIGYCEYLGIFEIPDGIDFCIGDYDGIEFAYEKGRVWGPCY